MFKRKPRANVYRDKMGRFCSDPDMPTVPAVFTGIFAADYSEKELDDLEDYRRSESDTVNLLMLRKALWREKRKGLTRFTAAEVHWMDALNDMGADEKLPGFPFKSDAEMYADQRWLKDYLVGLTTEDSLESYKEQKLGRREKTARANSRIGRLERI